MNTSNATELDRDQEIAALRHKLWMIASRATGGGIPKIEGIDRSISDICGQITASRNAIYAAGKEMGAREAKAALSDAPTT